MLNINNAILSTLSYFHVFKFPLEEGEIWKYMPHAYSATEFRQALQHLRQEKNIFLIDNYYSLSNDRGIIERRNAGCKYAQRRIKTAGRIARFLGNFPFVDSVFISGSLSKDFALPDSDLDFFIVTAENRLWIARSLMHIFKKLTFLVGAQHSFCMNYYVSLDHLKISPENIFTAVELATLKPAFYGHAVNELYLENEDWIQRYLPNFPLRNTPVANDKKWLPTRICEWLLEKAGAEKLNERLYKLTYAKWIRKWNRKNFDVNKCKECIGYHYNTPVNFPKDYPEMILNKHKVIYDRCKINLADPFSEKAFL